MNKMRSWFGLLRHFLNPRLVAVILAALLALAWTGSAWCGEIHEAAKTGHVQKVEAKTLVTTRDGITHTVSNCIRTGNCR